MPKSLLSLALLFGLAVPAVAQEYAIDRGAWVLGGSVSWSTSGGDLNENADGDRLNSILINPRALYLVIPGLAVGGDLIVESLSQGDADFTTIGVGPKVAYFFGGPESSVYPYIAGSIGYAKMTTDGFDASGLAFGGEGGAAFMLTRSVALTAAASYRVQSISVDQVDDSVSGNTFALALGVEAFLF